MKNKIETEKSNTLYGGNVWVGGVEYVLDEQATCENDALADCGMSFSAPAHIANSGEGATHQITWDINEPYASHLTVTSIDPITGQYTDDCPLPGCDACPCMDDESNFCDWDTPARVELQ